MKPVRTIVILLFLLLFFAFLSAQEKYSTVKIHAPADKTARAQLIGLLKIDHFQTADDGDMVAELSASEIARLKRTSYTYKVIVDDVALSIEIANRRYYAERTNVNGPVQNRVAFEQTGRTSDQIIPAPAAFIVQPSFGGYYSFAQMEAAMDDLVEDYPSIVQKTSLGKSHENRDIWCIKISDAVATDESNEPEVLFMGLQHAREAIGGSSMIFLMQYLCENYTVNPKVRDLVNNREVFIIPCMNPDGWEYNRTHGGAGSGWRKNRRNNGGGDFGVDLNRNWGVDWSNCRRPIVGDPTSCGTNDPSDDTYYGPSAFSEPETRAIRDFTYNHHLVAMIDQHAYGPYYSLPFGRPSLPTNVMPAADDKFYTYLSSAMGNYNGMRAGNSPQALGYEVAGGVKDWMLKGDIGTGTKGKIYGLTGEGGAGGGTAGTFGSFWAPASQIISLCKGMTYQNIQLLFTAGSYVNLQDLGEMNLTSKTGTLNFSARRVGLENRPVTVSLVPLENIQSVGLPVTITSLTNYDDTYTGGISYTLSPALINGQRLRFAWKIETGGYTYSDTVTKFYNGIQVFSDDMEGNFLTNWASVSTNTDPDVTDENWSFTTLDQFAGSKSMTESASGNYFPGTNRTVTYRNTFDLSDATAAYLSFWTKHRAENFRDKLRVQVSADGGTWISIAGTTTVQEPGTLDGSTINGIPALTGIKTEWTRELFDLSNWAGEPALRLRFQFTSGASSSFDFSEDDGFYIDNINVVKSNVALITLPVKFISFTGQLLDDQTIRLDWNATVDAQHDYFEVEKSADGVNFSSIGRGPSSAPYWKIDPSPFNGQNYYRIKQTDINGSISYSNTIRIAYVSSSALTVYPNPVKDVLNIRINTDAIALYTVSIIDAAGRKIVEEKLLAGPGSKHISINMSKHTAQAYLVVVRNSNNQRIATLKVAKL
jgi:carboxypeptidase T